MLNEVDEREQQQAGRDAPQRRRVRAADHERRGGGKERERGGGQPGLGREERAREPSGREHGPRGLARAQHVQAEVRREREQPPRGPREREDAEPRAPERAGGGEHENDAAALGEQLGERA
jgi:hypothetical protein